jgi:BirA family biotin operon repressor/biotin-[acetyl-CoA-carboxylase] ligase
MHASPGFAELAPLLIQARTFIKHVELFGELPSTNSYALETSTRRPLPRLIVAARQTAGRGRMGRAWWSGEGSLAASLVVQPADLEVPPDRVPRVALAAGLAVLNACDAFCDKSLLELHWPNDVYAGEGKLAGVLCESASGGELVIGMGVNVNNTAANAPPELRGRVATLRDLRGEPVGSLDFVVALLKQLEIALGLLAREPAELAARCDRRLLQKGAWLKVQTGRETVSGRCLGIGAEGALILETAAGMRSVVSGSVLR